MLAGFEEILFSWGNLAPRKKYLEGPYPKEIKKKFGIVAVFIGDPEGDYLDELANLGPYYPN